MSAPSKVCAKLAQDNKDVENWIVEERKLATERFTKLNIGDGFLEVVFLPIGIEIDKIVKKKADELRTIARNAECHNTGWPIGVVLDNREGLMPKACKVCCEVLDAVLKEQVWFRGYVFDNSKIDLSYFGTHKTKARYTAYNFFTKETLRIFTKDEENAVVYSDEKARAVKDNFIFYVKDSINNNTQPPKTVIKHLQAIDSKTDDIMQVTDLIIGAINNKVQKVVFP